MRFARMLFEETAPSTGPAAWRGGARVIILLLIPPQVCFQIMKNSSLRASGAKKAALAALPADPPQAPDATLAPTTVV